MSALVRRRAGQECKASCRMCDHLRLDGAGEIWCSDGQEPRNPFRVFWGKALSVYHRLMILLY